MRSPRFALIAALAAPLGLAAMASPAPAQMIAPAGTAYYVHSGPGYASRTTAVADAARRGTVLPGFSSRGGIGTTPYLGNIRGLGANSTNFDAARTGYASPTRRGYRRGR